MNKQEAYKLARYAAEYLHKDIEEWSKGMNEVLTDTRVTSHVEFMDYLDDNGYEIIKKGNSFKDEYFKLRAKLKENDEITTSVG